MPKRTSDEIEKDAIVLKTCSCWGCKPFCASWGYDYRFGVERLRGRHYDPEEAYYYHDSDESGYDAIAKAESEARARAIEIGPGHDGCTREQRTTLLCCLKKIAEKNRRSDKQFHLLKEPTFLEHNFKDLLCEEKVLQLAILYSCNNVTPECHALARNFGLAELEEYVGELHEIYGDSDDESVGADAGGDNESETSYKSTGPYEVAQVDGWDEAKHFLLSVDQWDTLRGDGRDCYWRPRMSIFTYRNVDSVNVADILESFELY